jgi:2-methylisocitrate lyase-like PEP mutase family enzyme
MLRKKKRQVPFKANADLGKRREDGLAEATTLRALLQRDGCLTLPGVYDGISARMAASIGFDALYMTGYGVVASALGVADAGTATFTEMLDRVRCIAGAISVPFIADGDTGYGGLLNVDRTVRGYAAAGASGIQLEDSGVPEEMRPHRIPPRHSGR